jgi:DNA-binding NarL/FixJ family response regulator
LRIGIRAVLDDHGEIAVAGEVGDGAGLLGALRHGQADVMLAGLGLLRHIGVAAFQAVRNAGAGCRLLVHSYEWDRDFGAEAARFGAAGYVSRDCSQADLRVAVLDVAAGKPFVTAELGAHIAEAACFRATARLRGSLSARERQVFRMLAIGLDVPQIATQLGMSLRDAAECKWRIAAKIDVTEAGELVRHAVAHATRMWPRREMHGR